MKKSFAVGLVVLVTGVFAYSLSTFFPFGSVSDPEIEAGSALASKPQKTMRPFGSEEALKAHFKKIADKQERARREMTKSAGNTTNQPSPSSVATDSMAASESKAGPDKDDGITNNQPAGVDEGGIVTVHG